MRNTTIQYRQQFASGIDIAAISVTKSRKAKRHHYLNFSIAEAVVPIEGSVGLWWMTAR